MAEKKQVLRIDIKGNEELIRLRQSLQQYQKQLKDLRKEHKDSETLTKSQATEFANLELNVKKTRSEFNKASKSVKGLNDSTKKGIGFVGKMTAAFTAANLATMAFTKASQAMKNAIQDSVSVFADFDIQMQKVKAISGANASEFSKLEKSAQDLGRSTFFTATQVGELQMNFSKLGFSATETLDAQSAALDMATATGEDLARTATVIGSSIRGFNLDADQAGRVADVMAASFTSSALDLEKFQTSMTKVAPIAELMGVSMEATTAIMGKLSDAGIEASIAGTSLRNIFLKMGDPSSDLSKALGKTVGSGQELVAELKRLRDAGVDVEKMLAVVDQRQVAAFATMVKGVDAIESQILAFERSEGAAKAMADTVGDSLQGAMLRFSSALDGLKIVLVDQIGENLQSVIDKFAVFFNFLAKSAEVPLSEKLNEDRLSLNKFLIELNKVNFSQEQRKNLIIELKKEYPNYLSHLDTEKSSSEDVKKALKGLNDQLAMKILLQKESEKIAEQQEDEADRLSKVLEREDVLERLIEKQMDARGLSLKENLSLVEQGQNILEQLTTQLREENIGGKPKEVRDLENAIQFLELAQKKLSKETQEGNKLIEGRAELLQRLIGKGFIPDETGEGETTTTTSEGGGGGKTVDSDKAIEDATALMDAEMAIRNERQGFLEDFANGEIQTKADLNAKLLQMEIEHLQFVTDQNLATGDELMQIEEKLLNARVKRKELEQKADVDRIKQLEETGRLLMEVGKATGENNALTAIGIKVTQAAAVASGIKGLIEATSAPAKQAVAGDPFSAFLRVASMASMMVSVIANLKGLLGGSGGGREATVTEFANGGLLQGGMFKGASHANGGVKFAVGGRIHEAEGGEAIINKRSTAAFRPILSAINSYNGNGVKFAEGGLLSTGEKFAMGGELKSVQSMISGGGTQRVVLVESDVTSTQNRISALEARASF